MTQPSPRPPLLSLLSGAMLAVLLFLFSSMALAAISRSLGFDLSAILNDPAPGERELHFLRFSQGFTLLLGFGLAAWMWALREGEQPVQILGLAPASTRNLLWAVALVMVINPLAAWLYISPDHFHLPESLKSWEQMVVGKEERTEAIIRLMITGMRWDAMLMNFFVIAVIPAICEELFFRGYLLGTLRRFAGGHGAVWISAFVFSFFHFQFLGFFTRMLLGVGLGYLYQRSGSLRLSILAHFCHNFFQLVVVWILIAHPVEGIDPFKTEMVSVSTIAAFFSLLLTVLVIRQVKPEPAS